MKIKAYYFDMDGVLADFNSEPKALKRFKVESGFFANLKPIRNNIHALKVFSRENDVYIITASPNEQADQDKIAWVKKHLPNFPLENMIICRLGDNKADYVKNVKGCLLFDDYGKNCREWEARGGQAFKVSPQNPILRLTF